MRNTKTSERLNCDDKNAKNNNESGSTIKSSQMQRPNDFLFKKLFVFSISEIVKICFVRHLLAFY